MSATPPFVRWTLPLACALREETDVTDPQQTERQLRSLRTYSDCLHAGRELDGVCISADDPTMGFPALEVLNAYGGAPLIHAQCDGCALNVVRGRARSGLAGCFGLLALKPDVTARVDDAIERAGIKSAINELFLPTTPRWYGLFAQQILDAPRITVLQQVFAAMSESLSLEKLEFQTALELALRASISLHMRCYPAGESEPDGWRLQAHCGRCKAPMAERARQCGVCGLLAHAEPRRQRKTRGIRPFVPLARFLGAQGAQDFQAKYADGRVP